MGKTDLQAGRNYVNIVGKVKINDNTFSGILKSKHSDWQYVRTNIGIETAEGNIVYAQLMGGYSPSNPVIYAFGKEKDSGMIEVNWNDRFNEKVLETINSNSFHKIGLTREESKDENKDGKLIVKEFLSPVDAEEYIQEHLEDGMEISVRGNLTYQEYNGEVQRQIEIRDIYLPYRKEKDDEIAYGAKFTQTILVSDDSYKKISKAEEKEGEVVIPVTVASYVSKIDGVSVKKNMPFGIAIVAKINKDKPEQTKAILDKLFKIKKNTVREITIEGDLIEGYDQSEVSNEDIELSPEIKELIEMGLYSEEEAKDKMVVRGNRVSKMVFARPFIQRDPEDATKLNIEINDTKYKPEDLYVDIDEVDSGSDDTEEEASVDDQEWLKALGV